MQRKDQTFSKLCEFKVMVEKESGKKVKALRRIQRELIALHKTQQNGVAERKNKMIMGVARARLACRGGTACSQR